MDCAACAVRLPGHPSLAGLTTVHVLCIQTVAQCASAPTSCSRLLLTPASLPLCLRSYTISYTNTRFTCNQQLPLSAIQSACPELATAPNQFPSQQCFAATIQAIFGAQCPLPQCVNYCRAACT
jgi:hypothetical protein